MGINAINCEGGYAESGKANFGEGTRSASDFEGTGILKGVSILALLAAGTLVAGCLESSDNRPPPAKVEYDKNASPITMGRIDTDEQDHFSLDTGKGLLLENGLTIGLRRITENVSVSKDSPFDNVCRVKEYYSGFDVEHYHLNCLTNPASDAIGIGDYVAAYKVVEAQK